MDSSTLMILAGVAVAVAPGWAITWVAVAKMTLEAFQSADTQAVTEKANPGLVK